MNPSNPSDETRKLPRPIGSSQPYRVDGPKGVPFLGAENPWKLNPQEWYLRNGGRYRDSKRLACYQAERAAFSTANFPIQPGHTHTSSLRRLLAGWMRSHWWTGLGLPSICPNVLVTRSKRISYAYACIGGIPGSIYLSQSQLNSGLPEWLFVHELAHSTLQPGIAHGEPWRIAYITLIEYTMGYRMADALATEMAIRNLLPSLFGKV